jgi:hypothetical protein
MEEIEFSWWLCEGRPRQGNHVPPDGLIGLCFFVGSSKSHRENSISCILLESPHQVDMKSIVKCWKDILWYFATLKTYRVQTFIYEFVNANQRRIDQFGPRFTI